MRNNFFFTPRTFSSNISQFVGGLYRPVTLSNMTDQNEDQLKNILLIAGGLLVLFQSAIPTPWEFIAIGLIGTGAVLLYAPSTWWRGTAIKNWFNTR
jgi:hypothetical protein